MLRSINVEAYAEAGTITDKLTGKTVPHARVVFKEPKIIKKYVDKIKVFNDNFILVEISNHH